MGIYTDKILLHINDVIIITHSIYTLSNTLHLEY